MSRRPVGSVDEESRLLAAALRRSWGENGDPGPRATERSGECPASAAPDDETVHHGGPECTSCPWCRSGEWRREHGADMLRSLADVASLAAEGLRNLADSWQRPAGDDHTADDEPAPADSDHVPEAGAPTAGAGAASTAKQAGGGTVRAPAPQTGPEQHDERQESA